MTKKKEFAYIVADDLEVFEKRIDHLEVRWKIIKDINDRTYEWRNEESKRLEALEAMRIIDYKNISEKIALLEIDTIAYLTGQVEGLGKVIEKLSEDIEELKDKLRKE